MLDNRIGRPFSMTFDPPNGHVNGYMPARYRVSVVIPALNEASNLPHVLPRIPRWVDEVILVDGYSTDGTPEIAERLWPGIRIVTQQGIGKGAALRSGFAMATGDIIVMLDADGSTDPAEIPAFVGALLAGADFAKGSRFAHGGGTADMPTYRQVGNQCFVRLVRLLFGGRYSDLCYGYNAFWRSLVPLLCLDGDGFEIETMMNVRALRTGMKVVEVPSVEAKRVYGDGRLKTIPDGWRVLRTIWLERHFAVRIAVHSWAESMRHGDDSLISAESMRHGDDSLLSEDPAWIEGRD